jgi:uncharacterized short protein YbdD (DUF466 family)
MFKKGLETIAKASKYIGDTARLMVGVPDYDTYVQHMHTAHPDQPVMSYEEFFRERQNARYDSSKAGRCC